jgi:serine/threonine protein kinase
MNELHPGTCAPADMDIPHLPNYELHDELVGNSLTRRFAARHRAGGFACVVKTPRVEAATDPVANQIITREARLGLSVRSRHVVKLFDAQIHHPPYYVVTEQLIGDSLSDRLQDGSLTWDQSVQLAQQIARGLAAIHRIGFVHANLQPGNIVVALDGSAIVTELGAAHRPGEGLSRNDEYSEHTAPELFNSVGHTFASDWFSFGLILAELLGDDSSICVDHDPDILQFRRKREVTPSIGRRLGDWPTRLSALMAKLTSPHPDARPTATFVVNELGQLELNDYRVRQAA